VIQIDEPPDTAACATCGPLVWLWSRRREAWVAFIAAPDGGPHAIRPHPCRHAQDYPTWREVREPDPPSAEYVEARKAIGHKIEKLNEESE
jgi:hypothetical protein